MTFAAPTAEIRFALDHVTGLSELAADERFAHASEDIVDAVLEGAAAFARDEWLPLVRTGDTVGARWTADGVVMPDGFPQAYQAFVDSGWGAVSVPAEHGGQGLPFVLQTAVLDMLGAANPGFTLCPILTVGAVEALVHHGTPEQQATYLPKLATGEWTGTMNLTESQAGSDVGALRATAAPLGDGRWAVSGTKIFISFGDHNLTDNIVHLVLARTPEAPAGTRGISLFLVPKRRMDGTDNHVRVVSIEHKMGLHASPTCVLVFGDEGNSIGELIGPEHGGMRAMFTMMNNARLNVGLQGVQIAEAATQRAVAYARDRVQGARAGQTIAIIEHPDVRRMLLRMKAQTLAARSLVYYSAAQVDRATLGVPGARGRLDVLTPLAKAHATELGIEVASLGMQVHGGMGYIEETGAAQLLRDARITPIYEGTNGIQAADLVIRKLGLAGGEPFLALLQDLQGAEHPQLRRLVDACDRVTGHLLKADVDDRLAASWPFLQMLSIAVSGWLLERQQTASDEDAAGLARGAVIRFYLDQIVPEALGLEAAASAPAATLYAISAAAF